MMIVGSFTLKNKYINSTFTFDGGNAGDQR